VSLEHSGLLWVFPKSYTIIKGYDVFTFIEFGNAIVTGPEQSRISFETAAIFGLVRS
jgi:hypothetical protein